MPDQTPIAPTSRMGRRGALSTIPLVVLAGCSWTGDRATGPDESPTPTAVAAGPGADVRTAVEAEAEIGALLDRLERTGDRHPRLRSTLLGPTRAHAEHRMLVREAIPPGSPPTPGRRAVTVPGQPRRALSVVLIAERALETTLAGLATGARSGPFARVLASMSAACAQQATVLEVAVSDTPDRGNKTGAGAR